MVDYYTCKNCGEQHYLTWYVEAGEHKFCSHKCHIIYAIRHKGDTNETDCDPSNPHPRRDASFGD